MLNEFKSLIIISSHPFTGWTSLVALSELAAPVFGFLPDSVSFSSSGKVLIGCKRSFECHIHSYEAHRNCMVVTVTEMARVGIIC